MESKQRMVPRSPSSRRCLRRKSTSPLTPPTKELSQQERQHQLASAGHPFPRPVRSTLSAGLGEGQRTPILSPNSVPQGWAVLKRHSDILFSLGV